MVEMITLRTHEVAALQAIVRERLSGMLDDARLELVCAKFSPESRAIADAISEDREVGDVELDEIADAIRESVAQDCRMTRRA